jgi:hypothetical protein
MNKKKNTEPKKEPLVMNAHGKGFECINDSIVLDKYKIGKPINGGAYGEIYTCVEIQTNKSLVMKFSEDYEILAIEI